jgi:hypothetical protein
MKNNMGGMDIQKRCNIPTLLPISPSDLVRGGFGPRDNSGEENYGTCSDIEKMRE